MESATSTKPSTSSWRESYWLYCIAIVPVVAIVYLTPITDKLPLEQRWAVYGPVLAVTILAVLWITSTRRTARHQRKAAETAARLTKVARLMDASLPVKMLSPMFAALLLKRGKEGDNDSRWNEDERGPVDARTFIAEVVEIVNKLGYDVIGFLASKGEPPFELPLNISPKDCQHLGKRFRDAAERS